MPDAPDVILMKSELVLTAVQAQVFELAVTVNVPVAPVVGSACTVKGFRVKLHDADCVTVKVAVPTLMVPTRLAFEVLAVAVY